MSGWLDVGGDRHGIVSEARWLSIRQIAGDLGVSSSMAYKWSARGVPWFPRTVRLHKGTFACDAIGTNRLSTLEQ
jgi:predicted DNA-binding transcriptional regulator AlpA